MRSRCAFPGCLRVGTEEHHRKLRSRGGSDRAVNQVMLCWEHHDWAHDQPRAAHALILPDGYPLVIHSWEPEPPDQVQSLDAVMAHG